jgi:hypothetical protein
MANSSSIRETNLFVVSVLYSRRERGRLGFVCQLIPELNRQMVSNWRYLKLTKLLSVPFI